MIYPDHTLGTLEKFAVAELEFWCLRPDCRELRVLPLSALLPRYGIEATLVSLARRARCTRCGAQGAHVQPSPALASSAADYGGRRIKRVLALRGELQRLAWRDDRH